MKTFATILSPIVLVALMAGAAQSAYALSATQTVWKEIRTEDASGNTQVDYVEATLVTPGETVIYRLEYINDADEPVTDMVLTMPVPPEIIYRDGSADKPGTRTIYSADGGETFAPRDNVTMETVDGTAFKAEAEHITHVRWIFTQDLPPGGTGEIAFAGQLR